MNSHNMLHILGPTRREPLAAIVGDRAALERLRHALDETLATGSGGACAAASDGEPFLLAIALQPDMQPIHTTYADEAEPVRSLREQIPLRQVPNFAAACAKAATLQEAAQPLAPRGRPCRVVGAAATAAWDDGP